MVLRADLIEMLEVDAHSERLILLGQHDNIGEPLGVVNLTNEVGRQQLGHLFPDCLPLLCGGPAQALSDGPSGGIHVQSVLSQLPGYTWHVRGFPCEDVPVLTEELGELGFLFRIEGGGDVRRGSSVTRRVDADLLRLSRRLECRLRS